MQPQRVATVPKVCKRVLALDTAPCLLVESCLKLKNRSGIKMMQLDRINDRCLRRRQRARGPQKNCSVLTRRNR